MARPVSNVMGKHVLKVFLWQPRLENDGSPDGKAATENSTRVQPVKHRHAAKVNRHKNVPKNLIKQPSVTVHLFLLSVFMCAHIYTPTVVKALTLLQKIQLQNKRLLSNQMKKINIFSILVTFEERFLNTP